MKIGIVGGGVVGHATARAFMEHADVSIYDIDAKKRTHDLNHVLDANLVFVCLPTPQKKDSLECDTSALDEFFDYVKGTVYFTGKYVIRSTVPVGYTLKVRNRTDMRNLLHSPEFLTARCSVVDAQTPSRNIVGYTDTSAQAAYFLRSFLMRRFPGVPCLMMTTDESELVKLAVNGFFATKVAYFNEVNELASSLNLNWTNVLHGILSDGRIAHSHTQVPGPDGEYGFGGTCLPKDSANLAKCRSDNGLDQGLISSVLDRNDLHRKAVVK